MSIQLEALEVCDLKNGRIVLKPEAPTASGSENSIQLTVTVTDGQDRAHDLATTSQAGVIRFDMNAAPRPIRSFRLSEYSSGSTVFEARNLYPSSDQEFETQFKAHRDRSGDRRIDYFVASQIFNYFDGQEGYRISAAVVAAYKAIELMDESYLAEAETTLLRALTSIPSVKLARSTRNNREHLHVSVLCALYHVYLARGEAREFLRTLLVLKGLLETQDFQSYYNLAYNSALSLRLLTLLHLVSDQPKAARSAARLSFNVYKSAARDADENLAHFKELRYVHDNTYESMRLARRSKDAAELLIDRTLRSCLRVPAEEHPKSFSRMRATFLATSDLLPSAAAS